MNEKDNLRVIHKVYESFGAKDIAGIVGAMAEDVTWELPEMEYVPYSGTRNGKEGVNEFFNIILQNMCFKSFEPKAFYTNADGVAVYGTYSWAPKATGKTSGCGFMHLFTIKEGKVIRFRELMDTAVMNASFAPVEEAIS
jgi:ketosteroid isomerase-like protein